MKKIFVLLLVVSTSAFSQKTVQTSNYDNIGIIGNFEIELVQGKEGKMELSGPEDGIRDTEISCEDGFLKIKKKQNSKTKSVVIRVPVEDISGISVIGSATVFSKTTIPLKDLSNAIQGSGTINLKLDADTIHNALNGSGNIVLKGKANSVTNQLIGSGTISTQDVAANKASLNIIGSGSISAHANQEISLALNGSGTLKYSGNPAIVNQNIQGSGKIKTL